LQNAFFWVSDSATSLLVDRDREPLVREGFGVLKSDASARWMGVFNGDRFGAIRAYFKRYFACFFFLFLSLLVLALHELWN
jgi:hypothetical protein